MAKQSSLIMWIVVTKLEREKLVREGWKKKKFHTILRNEIAASKARVDSEASGEAREVMASS